MANFKEQKRHHFTYRTTNLVNGRYYLGMHSTNRIDDGYLGSGKRLYYELNKYGRDNFKFEILKQFSSREELVQAEINLITEQDLKNPNCLNCKPGGNGGFSSSDAKKGQAAGTLVRNQKMLQDPEYRKRITEAASTRRREEIEQGKYYPLRNFWKGKQHRPESIEKMSNTRKGSSVGKGVANSQYGTCWITNEVNNKKIYKGDTIPEGWRLGRRLSK
jgi:hypothetical protein